jgi:hypothetical protein
MGVHVSGLTVRMLTDASRAARVVDSAVTLIDDVAHMVIIVDQSGRVLLRPDHSVPA